jgi:hypothetical protein
MFYMAIETIGEAYSLGWPVSVRCGWGAVVLFEPPSIRKTAT